MNNVPAPSALLDMPPMAGRSALRAGLAAMQVQVIALPADRQRGAEALRGLSAQRRQAAFVDISRGATTGGYRLLDLDAILPLDDSRQRVFLTRLADGHVAESDRRWVRRLGFADLIGST